MSEVTRGALSSKRGPNTTGWLETSLAKDPTICSCEYRNCEYLLRWRSLWGHEPHEGRAELRGGVHNTNEDDRSNYERLNAGESERE